MQRGADIRVRRRHLLLHPIEQNVFCAHDRQEHAVHVVVVVVVAENDV